MGYKEIFVDYKTLSFEEVKRHKEEGLARLKERDSVKYNKEIQKEKERKPKLKEQNQSLKYRKKMNTIEKLHLVEAFKDGKSQFVAFHDKNNISNKIAYDIKLRFYKDAIKWLMHVNLITFLGIEVQPGKNFHCGLIKGNIASVNFDSNGYWRYFTRNRESTEGYVLGIIDIVEIIYHLNFYQAVTKLCEMTLIDVEEGKWLILQKRRYLNNISNLHIADKEMAVQYPILYKYIKRHLYILKELNSLGISTLTNNEKSIDGIDIFFISTRFLEKKLNSKGIKKSHTNINKLLNMFFTIGLVLKIPLNKAPQRLQEEAKKFQKIKASEVVKNNEFGKKACHPISFYQIPAMTDNVLQEAERRVICLNKCRIKATGIIITDNRLKEALGIDIFNSLFKEKEGFIKIIEKAKREKMKK
jgi:hypothetical protein